MPKKTVPEAVPASSGFAGGILLLTVSNLLVKAAGLLFRVPLNALIGDTGMGYYHAAYAIYTVFYMAAAAGLPVALSVMVARERSRGRVAAAKKVYRLVLGLFVCLGVTGTAVMLFGAEALSGCIRSEKSAAAVIACAPTMLFICLSSAIRGYYQGCGCMTPTAISQLVETFGKVGLGMAGALYAVRRGEPIEIVAAFAAGGLTAGSFLGMVYLLLVRWHRGDRDLLPDGLPSMAGFEKPPTAAVLAEIRTIAWPVTVSAFVMSLTNTLDAALIQRMLRREMSAEAAAALYGNYTSLAVPLFNLPPAFVYPVAYALVPAVAASFAAGCMQEVRQKSMDALRYAVLIGLPCACGLAVLADPILCLLYPDASAHMASRLLVRLAPASFFVCVLAVTNVVLQACGQEKKPVWSMLCGAAVKLFAGVLFLHLYGIAGAPVSTFCGYAAAAACNMLFVIRVTGLRPAMRDVFWKPLAASLVCALCAVLVQRETGQVLLAIPAAAAVYAGAVFYLGSVHPAELRNAVRRVQRKEKHCEGIHTES